MLKWNTSTRPSLLSVMVCAVYWVSVHASPPGGNKSTSQSSSVKGRGTLDHFYLFSFFIESSMHWGVSILWECSVSDAWITQSVLFILCFHFIIYFSDILLLHVREPYRKLYMQSHVAICSGWSHQSNHIERTCSFNFLITHLG